MLHLSHPAVYSSRFAFAAFAVLALCGCVTKTKTTQGPYTVSSSDGGNTATMHQSVAPSPNRPKPAFDGPESCDEQLQNICDALLNYYARKRQLPEKLEDLVPYTIEGPLKFSCPDSGRPYVYDRNGPYLNQSTWLTNPRGQPVQMSQPDSRGQLIIYDAEPVHNGQRWCIVFGRDTRGNGLRADPCKIPDKVLTEALAASHGAAPQQP